MPHTRHVARRRRCRPATRLVDRDAPWTTRLLDPNLASGYQVGLLTARLMATHYADFYQEHVAQQAITPGGLFGVAEAFLSLVNQVLPLQEWAGELALHDDPLRALHEYDATAGNLDHLATLDNSAWYLDQPHIEMYGLGVELVRCEERDGDPALLDVALWHLLRHTGWGLAFDIEALLKEGIREFWDVDAAELVLGLVPLPAETPMDWFRKEVRIDKQPWTDRSGEVVAYAVAQCNNGLANVTNGEIDLIYGGRTDLSWDDLPSLIEQAADASTIQHAYWAWQQAVSADPHRLLPLIVKQLHAAARRATQRVQAQPKALIDILFEPERIPA